MRNRLLFVAFLFSIISSRSLAQMSGGNLFLQGHWVEIGENNEGAFGTCNGTVPAGYHPHMGGASWNPGDPLGEVYDYGKDGWSVAAIPGYPPFMGDYTEPGYPFEGWSIQVGATEYRNWTDAGFCGGSFFVPGSITSYSNTGGVAAGTFTGNIAGIHLVAETRVDTEGSAVVVTVRFYNTTAASIANVYYERTCDPDNVSTWGGSYSTTHNRIVHQNEDASHKVLVSATAEYPSGTYAIWTYLGLGTKDCRAVATFFGHLNNWSGLTPSYTPSQYWAKTVPAAGNSFTLADSNFADVGYNLTFKIGTLTAAGTPGDSAVISYAYFFNGNSGIDSVFPDPSIVINGVPGNFVPVPYPSYDTFYACAHPGLTSIPVSLLHADDKCWSWSTWTWAPAAGLASTTGVRDTVDLNVLSGPITYTITGVDSSANGFTCNHKVFYLTIFPCHTAHNNGPCVGDTLWLGDRGDSLGATYFWYGPGGFTSVLQNPFLYPSTLAEAGLYYVVKSRFGVNDTDSTNVTIHNLPVAELTASMPVCGLMQPTLNLYANPDSGWTYSWSGPQGFTSTMEYPDAISPFDSSKQGYYSVNIISQWGCKNTFNELIWAMPDPQYDTDKHLGCVYDTVHFINLSSNADSFVWDFGDMSPRTSIQSPTHIFAGHIQDTVRLTCYNPHCESSIYYYIDLRHSVHSIFHATPDTFCFGLPDTLVNNSYSDKYGNNIDLMAYKWDFGDGSFDFTAAPPPHIFNQPGWYTIALTVQDSLNCLSTMTDSVYAVQLTISSLHDTLLCLAEPLALKNRITANPNIVLPYNYSWSESSQNLNDLSIQVPYVWGIGNFTDILTVTIPGLLPDACPTLDTINIHSVIGKRITNMTPDQAIAFGSSIQLTSDSQVIYRWIPNDGSLDNNNINNPIATPLVTTTYTVYGLDINGCLDSANVTIYVDSSMNEGIPTAFTPNGDGINDVFHVVGIRFQHLVEMRIFNRWGQEVFYTNDAKKGWDGKFNGVQQDLGTYFYSIIAARPGGTGMNITYKGEITLIR